MYSHGCSDVAPLVYLLLLQGVLGKAVSPMICVTMDLMGHGEAI